jgi:DNA-binding response OmpR family regulator
MSATVLIIDDDRELCALLSEFLALEGFATQAIHHGAEPGNRQAGDQAAWR